MPNIYILEFCNNLYMEHTFCSCLIRCIKPVYPLSNFIEVGVYKNSIWVIASKYVVLLNI